MPSPDRVIKEIKGQDEQNAIERQMGAFKRLLEMIDYMAYGLERRNLQFPEKYATPDELRFKEIYGKAYADLWYKAKNRDGWINYVHDGNLWSEMNDKLFSKSFHDLYRQAENNTSGRMEQHRKEMDGVSLTIGPAPTAASSNDFMGLCAAKGLDPITCFVQTGMKKMLNASNSEPVVPGLRMSGFYQTGKFSISLNPYGDIARVDCGDVVRMMANYVVERRNNQIVLQIENEKDSFPLALGRDGTTLIGPVSVPIHGYSPGSGGGTTATTAAAAPQTVQTTRTRELTPLEAQQYPNAVKNGQTYTTTETTTSTEYAPLPVYQPAPWSAKTATCKIGTVPLLVPAAGAAEKSDDFFSKMIPDGEKIPDGLRMLGTYNGQGGAQVRFMPEKAIVGCSTTLLEKSYTVSSKGGMVSIVLQGAGGPKAFTLGPDGILRGDNGSLIISGRRKTGENALGDELSVPSTDTCAYGVLSPQGLKQTAGTQQTQIPAPTLPVSNAPTPARDMPPATGTGGLTITSSFASEPINPLANSAVLFLKESLDAVLQKNGFEASPGKSSISAWAAACKAASPRCAAGRQAIFRARVNAVKLDASGSVGFANIPVGTYWIVSEVTYNQRSYVWNVRIDIGAGKNTAFLERANVVADF